MSLLTNLIYYWDLDSADATITDQHSSLALSRVGTTTTDATAAPDGGPCINFGSGAGKYRNASVAKLSAYDTNFTINIWVRSTGNASAGNWVFNHRDALSPVYWQTVARRTGGAFANTDFHSIVTSDGAFSGNASQLGLNIWQMITGVRRGSNIEFWRNASLLDTAAITGTVTTGNAPFAIGGNSWDAIVVPSVNHYGQLAMAGLWGTALSAGQIASLYNSGNGRRYAALDVPTRKFHPLSPRNNHPLSQAYHPLAADALHPLGG